MLKSLTVRNFAVIEELTLEFGAGLNALTGETGAGKSILLEALGFLLGGRGSSAWLRAGASRLEVEGTFQIKDEQVLVRRELDKGGKTKSFINSRPTPLAELAAWGEEVADFHSQHEHQTLLKHSVQQGCLDDFGGLPAEIAAVAKLHERWSALCAQRQSARLSTGERDQKIDRARFQLAEIDAVRLRAGEEEELEGQLPLLKNAERILALAGSAYEILYDQEGSILAGLMKVERGLADLAHMDASMAPALSSLEGARLNISELADFLGKYKDRAEVNPEKLDKTLSRLEEISRIKKKYGGAVPEVLTLRERLDQELKILEGAPMRQENLERELKDAEEGLTQACEILHDKRMKAARRLEKAVAKELAELGLAQANFSIAVEMEEGRFTRSGADTVELLISANPGEPLRSLRSVASGGELSRVMLALKTALAQSDRVPVLIFDEVDAGVGGRVARSMGEKLARLGLKSQVLCVTHLPQVACFASTHMHLNKKVRLGRTSVELETLEGKRRLETIAGMLGGRDASAAGLKHARELLESSTR